MPQRPRNTAPVTCRKCGATKPVEAFSRTRYDVRRRTCSECMSKTIREVHAANRRAEEMVAKIPLSRVDESEPNPLLDEISDFDEDAGAFCLDVSGARSYSDCHSKRHS